ncbi:MAG: chemotaxis protein, partial [Pseudomonadota bacterium]
RYDKVTRENETQLGDAQREAVGLEGIANDMFDGLVQAGLSPRDEAMADHAMMVAREIIDATEAAIAEGQLSRADVFDQNYQPIPNSAPERFANRITDFAELVWKPIINRSTDAHEECVATVCADTNGFMPTHIEKFTRQPTGDLEHDTRFCRNGRILMDEADKAALASDAPYRLSVFRQPVDGQGYTVVRSAYVPLRINGERWGDLKFAYTLDGGQI